MAKKTESTAVNDLINLVASQGPSVKDPGADLFSEPPKRGARMTATLSGAGTVEPLPRTRAPAGTQQNASVNPPVRVSTVAPRASSIPPIPTASPDAARVRPSLPPPRSSASMPRPPIPSSAKIAVPSSTAIAPPTLDASDVDVDIDEDVEADLLKTPVAHQPRAVAPLTLPATAAPLTLPATAAPLTLPTAAPLTLSTAAEPIYPRAEINDHPNAASDMTGAAPWFEDSRAVDRLSIPDASHSMTENTAQVQRRGTVDLLKKLALPMGVAIVLGVFVGGYIVFDGQGGKKRSAQAPVASTDTARTDNAATPAVKTDDAVAPAVALPTEAKTDEAKTDEAKTDEAKTDEAKPEAVAAEPAKADEAKAEPVAAEPAKTEPAKVEPTKVAAVEPAKTSVLGGAVDSMPSTTTAAPKVTKTFVDVRIDSTPSGATVMLVDRGKTSFLGTTPISASVDPSRSYDIVFTYANKPTQVEHLDPKATTRLAVTLGKAGNQSKEVAKVSAPKAEKKAVTEVKVAKPVTTAKTMAAPAKATTTATPAKAKIADPFADDTAALEKKLAEKKAAKTEKPAPVEAEKAAVKPEKVAAKGGNGVLMISSKPPCEIWVDGASTGLMTPQRAMSLPAGKHKITLVSSDKAHKKTIAVEITADKSTKVIQDLLK